MAKTYKEHIVACIDLLGFSAALQSDKDDEEITKILQYFESCKQDQTIDMPTPNGGTYAATFTPKIITQTDQVILSISKENITPFTESNLIFAMVTIISQIAISTLMHGFLFRGGIASGKLYTLCDSDSGTKWNFDLASACAYKLESEYAKYPRIILSKELVSIAKNQPLLFTDKTESDDFYYINFLKFLFESGRYTSIAIENFIEKIEILIEENLINPELSEKDRVKWLWFKTYYEREKKVYQNKVEIKTSKIDWEGIMEEASKA
jgi:hypothetical protein